MSYSDIGVRTFINCCGTRTIHSGTLMLPCVREAMIEASRAFVNMDELMEGVGARIAELVGAEFAIVTSGGAASLCVAAASAVTGGDPEKIQRLPDVSGGKDRVVMWETGRFTYDQAIRAVGVEIVEVSDEADMNAALKDERVAMVALLGTDDRSLLPVKETAALAREHGVPVLVDAASEHLANPNPYLADGVTMVAYSGGKYLRGPQCTGLLIGEEKWVRAAWTNAAPHHTFARMMKVGKEEIMGILAAVEYWAGERDDKADYKRMERELKAISDEVTKVDGVGTNIEAFQVPGGGKGVSGRGGRANPRLEIRWPAKWVHRLELREALLEGEPRIMLDDRGEGEGNVYILPFSLQEGEGRIVGNAVRRVLERGSLDTPRLRSGQAPTAVATRDGFNASGSWRLEIGFHAGVVGHRMEIEQDGEVLRGRHEMDRLASEIAGWVRGDEVEIVAEHRTEGTTIVYTFRGKVEREAMRGDVEVGTEGQSAPGPLNRREYGRYPWNGKRRN